MQSLFFFFLLLFTAALLADCDTAFKMSQPDPQSAAITDTVQPSGTAMLKRGGKGNVRPTEQGNDNDDEKVGTEGNPNDFCDEVPGAPHPLPPPLFLHLKCLFEGGGNQQLVPCRRSS